MKLFGGGGSRSKKNDAEIVSSENDRSRKVAAPKAESKNGKKIKIPLTKQQKMIRTAVLMTMLAVFVALGAVAAHFIRPPNVNDPTIKDKENGDAVDVNGLLNSGQRIDDVFTFVVCAVDEDQTRTDAIMVATMNVREKTINIMNIPRDTMSNVGRTGAARKINAAYGATKGIEQTKIEIEKLLGFRPDKYIVVNFDGIAAIVDAIGGVDYEVPFRMTYQDPTQNLYIDLYAGMQHLNGKQTVEFLRWRHNNDYTQQYANGDEGRVENQQKFLKKLASDVFQLKNVTKIKQIADAVFQNVKTDFTAGELLWMGMQAMQIDNQNLQFFTLPGYGQMSTANSADAFSFYFPYRDQTLELVNKYFNPYTQKITVLDIVSGPEGSGNHSSNSSENYVWSDSEKTSSGSDSSWYDDGEESDRTSSSGNSSNDGAGRSETGDSSSNGSGEDLENQNGSGGSAGGDSGRSEEQGNNDDGEDGYSESDSEGSSDGSESSEEADIDPEA